MEWAVAFGLLAFGVWLWRTPPVPGEERGRGRGGSVTDAGGVGDGPGAGFGGDGGCGGDGGGGC